MPLVPTSQVINAGILSSPLLWSTGITLGFCFRTSQGYETGIPYFP